MTKVQSALFFIFFPLKACYASEVQTSTRSQRSFVHLQGSDVVIALSPLTWETERTDAVLFSFSRIEAAEDLKQRKKQKSTYMFFLIIIIIMLINA